MVTASVPARTTEGLMHPSMEEWILATVQHGEGQTLDQLAQALPQSNWAQVFLAIDRLSRAGTIRLMATGGSDYHISCNTNNTPPPEPSCPSGGG